MLIIFAFLTIILTTISTIFANLSLDQFGSKANIFILPFRVILHGAIILLTWKFFNNPWVYITMLAIIAIISTRNREGAHRKYSWEALLVLYFIVLLFSVANYADRHNGVYKISYLFWSIIPFIAATVANFGIPSAIAWFHKKQERAKDKTKTISDKVVRKLDNIAKQSSEFETTKTKPGYKKVKLSDLEDR